MSREIRRNCDEQQRYLPYEAQRMAVQAAFRTERTDREPQGQHRKQRVRGGEHNLDP